MSKHIVLCCATDRGLRVLKKMIDLLPDERITVFSFREKPWEPPFLDKIRQVAESNGAQFFEANDLSKPELKQFWDSNPVDLILGVRWRFLIPKNIYEKAGLGAFIFHDSYLPLYRGFSPTVWAMIKGEIETGVTLFEINEEVDDGLIVDQLKVPIAEDEYISSVDERVTQAYLELLEKNVSKLLNQTAPRFPNDKLLATYVPKRLPEDNQINWKDSAKNIFNLIRATSHPYPGAYTYLGGQKVYVWKAERLFDCKLPAKSVPGKVIEIRKECGVVVVSGDGALLITVAQAENEVECCASKIFSGATGGLLV